MPPARTDIRPVGGARHRSVAPTAVDPTRAVADPTATLVDYLQRIDDLLQERAVVLGHIVHLDPHDLFTHLRAELWVRREELAASAEPERLTMTWVLLARHARMLVRRAEGRSAPPLDHAALDAARGLRPMWRHLPSAALVGEPQTAIFRAMAHLRDPARGVLVLRWLGVGADDVADEMALGEDAVARLLADARAQLHHVLAGGGGR